MSPAPRSGLTLVVLAAGMGSRYRGLKQLEAVGPGGSALMDYSVFDARRAGFTDVVFVIRPDMAETFRPFAAERYTKGLRIATAHQCLDDLPAGMRPPNGRQKPWGTAHAVLAALREVHSPFAVVNADDFYGARAFHAVAEFLNEGAGSGERDEPVAWAVVGYRLRDTVSPAGGVNRGICRTTPDGWLTHMEEVVNIIPGGAGRFTGRTATGPVTLEGDALVSMNLWAFSPVVGDLLQRGFAEFLRGADPLQAEYLLPAAIQDAVLRDQARVRVLNPKSRWFGVTYPADRPAVADALYALVAQGRYPERLW